MASLKPESGLWTRDYLDADLAIGVVYACAIVANNTTQLAMEKVYNAYTKNSALFPITIYYNNTFTFTS